MPCSFLLVAISGRLLRAEFLRKRINQVQLAGILRLAVIQRPATDGRRIQNYHQADGVAEGVIIIVVGLCRAI